MNEHWNAIGTPVDGGVGPIPPVQQLNNASITHTLTPGAPLPHGYPNNTGPVTMYPQQGVISTGNTSGPIKPTITEDEMNYKFRMDNDTYKILGSLPEMYRNFIINFGIKLASEQEIYQYYLTNFMQDEVNADGVSQQVVKPHVKPAPSTAPAVMPAAAGGFNNW